MPVGLPVIQRCMQTTLVHFGLLLTNTDQQKKVSKYLNFSWRNIYFNSCCNTNITSCISSIFGIISGRCGIIISVVIILFIIIVITYCVYYFIIL